MTYAVSALVNKVCGSLEHVLWILEAASSDEAEAQAMHAALRDGKLLSVLVKPTVS